MCRVRRTNSSRLLQGDIYVTCPRFGAGVLSRRRTWSVESRRRLNEFGGQVTVAHHLKFALLLPILPVLLA